MRTRWRRAVRAGFWRAFRGEEVEPSVACAALSAGRRRRRRGSARRRRASAAAEVNRCLVRAQEAGAQRGHARHRRGPAWTCRRDVAVVARSAPRGRRRRGRPADDAAAATSIAERGGLERRAGAEAPEGDPGVYAASRRVERGLYLAQSRAAMGSSEPRLARASPAPERRRARVVADERAKPMLGPPPTPAVPAHASAARVPLSRARTPSTRTRPRWSIFGVRRGRAAGARKNLRRRRRRRGRRRRRRPSGSRQREGLSGGGSDWRVRLGRRRRSQADGGVGIISDRLQCIRGPAASSPRTWTSPRRVKVGGAVRCSAAAATAAAAAAPGELNFQERSLRAPGTTGSSMAAPDESPRWRLRVRISNNARGHGVSSPPNLWRVCGSG